MEHAANIAYPYFCFDTISSYEYLYAHELSHMWFGDKVTCDKAEEMWINEGWATFCEHYYVEVLDSPEAFKTAMRTLHTTVLKNYHTTLGDYYPMNNIPQNHTYTSIGTYDRGAATVQALRAYLGDDVFFPACVAYLEDYAFQSVSSYDMEASFTQNTGVDMSGFFNNWIYHGGTPHYSIDSVIFTENKIMYDVDIYLRQKRHGPSFTGDGNIIEYTVMGKDWSMHTDTMMFDGETGHKTISLDFEPDEVFLDLEEKYMDATVDNYKIFDEPDIFTFPHTYFEADIKTLTDSIFIQATHHLAPPDSMNVPVEVSRISDYRYWTIKASGSESYSITGGFDYRLFGLDNTLILSPYDSLVILYRENAGMPWLILEDSLDGTFAQGTLYVEDMPMGDYVLGIWDNTVSAGDRSPLPEKGRMEIFPNPSHGKVTFSIDHDKASRLEIYSFDGRLQESLPVAPGMKTISWFPDLPDGSYIAVLRSEDEQVIDSRKLILCK
jgi:aminopeptidase N